MRANSAMQNSPLDVATSHWIPFKVSWGGGKIHLFFEMRNGFVPQRTESKERAGSQSFNPSPKESIKKEIWGQYPTGLSTSPQVGLFSDPLGKCIKALIDCRLHLYKGDLGPNNLHVQEIHARSAILTNSGLHLYRLENLGSCCWEIYSRPHFRGEKQSLRDQEDQPSILLKAATARVVDCWRKLTSNNPSSMRVEMRNPVPTLVNKGVRMVNTDVAPIPIRKILFPPNLVANQPPGIWVKM